MITYNYQHLLLISCIISGIAGFYALFKRRMPGSMVGSVLILHGSIWTFMYILQNLSKHTPDIIFFYKIQSMFGYLMPTIFAIYLVHYFELYHNARYFLFFYIGITFVPAIVALQMILGDPSNLIWENLSVLSNNQVYADLGLFSQIMIAYNIIIMVVSLLYFVFTLLKPQKILKQRTLPFLIALIIYTASAVSDLLMLTPDNLLFSPFVFNVWSSAIMILNPEKMYKREALPLVYNVILEKMVNPVIVTDIKNKIMYLNATALKILKMEKVLFLQQDIRDVFESLFNYSLNENDGNPYLEYEGLIYQVREYTVEDWQKVSRSKIFILDDVTELVKYSKDLEVMVEEKTQRLREAERMADIGKITSMVGHDLRNPLQFIRLLVEELEDKFTEDPDNLEMVGRINKNILYMDKIVSDLQLLAKPRTPDLVETSIRMLFQEALDNVQIPDNVEFVGLTQDREIFVDADMFVRVLVNLVNNAVQAMPDGGRIWVDHVRDDGFDVISVSDSGVGISKEVVENLFTPFFTTKAKGMGLGLSVCKQVVEYHRGEIRVESREGEGTVFYIKIPSKDGVNVQTVEAETMEHATLEQAQVE
jgi:signal transduction histidine kinase